MAYSYHAHYRVKKETVTWTPSGGSAASIYNIVRIECEVNGQTFDVLSDANHLVEDIALFGGKAKFRITTINQCAALAIVQGKGALAFTLEKVATGTGAASGADKAFAAGNSVMVNIQASADMTAGGTATLEIETANTSGALFTIT
jgi:hypothetical protein